MPNQKRTLDEPAIRKLLTGLVRCGNRFYRPDPTGSRVPVAARAELMKLVSNATASRLLREALSVGLISEEKIDPANASAKQGEGKRDGAESELAAAIAASATDDDIEEQEKDELSPYDERQKQRARARFQLLKSVSRHGVYWGIYNADTNQQELISPDKREALQEIARRIAQEDMDHIPYYLQFRTGLAA